MGFGQGSAALDLDAHPDFTCWTQTSFGCMARMFGSVRSLDGLFFCGRFFSLGRI